MPSTHILKPANPKLVGLEAAEAAALTLAADIAIAAPHATTLEAGDQMSFIVERFDRTSDGQIARRLHAEDLGVEPHWNDQSRQPTPDRHLSVTDRSNAAQPPLPEGIDMSSPAPGPGASCVLKMS